MITAPGLFRVAGRVRESCHAPPAGSSPHLRGPLLFGDALYPPQMPRNDTAAFVTTTIRLRRDSLERLERVLVGNRNRDGGRISKRAVFYPCSTRR